MARQIKFNESSSKLCIGAAAGSLVSAIACAPALIGSGFSGAMLLLSAGVFGCLMAVGVWFWMVFNLTETELPVAEITPMLKSTLVDQDQSREQAAIAA